MSIGKGSLDLDLLKRFSCDRLIRILEDASGKKDIVIDGDLMKMLDCIADAKILRNHDVEKIFRLERVPPPVIHFQRVYIIHPTLIHLKYIADHIHSDLPNHPNLRYHLVAVPRAVSWIQQLFEEEGLHDLITIHEFSPDFIPLDNDLLSLEFHHFFYEAFLEGDFSSSVSVARALHTLQGLYGQISHVLSHGRAAQAVLHALKVITDQDPPKSVTSSHKQQIGYLFIFDRDADYVTPLLTQLTYEGILDEHYNIRAGVVELPAEVTESGKATKIQLDGRDIVFDGIRNRHFAGVSGYLVNRARDIQGKKQNTANMTPAQMKDFVAGELKTLQVMQKSLTLHLSICESITKNTYKDFDVQLTTEHGMITGGSTSSSTLNYLKDCFACQLPITRNLRLLCLLSLTQEGLPRKDYKDLCGQFLTAHGHKHLVTLHNLRQAGLLSLSDGNRNSTGTTQESNSKIGLKQVASSILLRKNDAWKAVAKKLKLIPDGDELIDLHNPSHMSYVFNGAYTPVIPKLVSDSLTRGADSVTEALKLIPGTTVCSGTDDPQKSIPRVALVLILGGVTFSEIAALRLLALTTNYKIIIATTNTVSGNSIIKSTIVV